jgi:hypothetical protein
MIPQTFWLCYVVRERGERAREALFFASVAVEALVVGDWSRVKWATDQAERLAIVAFTWDATLSRACGA